MRGCCYKTWRSNAETKNESRSSSSEVSIYFKNILHIIKAFILFDIDFLRYLQNMTVINMVILN